METKKFNKKMVVLFLSLVMVVASTGVVSAGMNSVDCNLGGGYTVTYEAYCYDSYGGASTYIYTDVATNVSASVEFYALSNTSGSETYIGSDTAYDEYYADVVIDSGSYYTGFYVETYHSVDVNNGEYSDSDELYEYN